LYLSFTKYAIGGTPQVIGLDNFVRALSGKDDLFWPSMGRTVEYAFVMVPIGIGLSLLAATLLNQSLKGTSVFRTLFFLPSLTPMTPTIFFYLVIGIIAAFKVFALAVLATQGGPNYATWFFNLHLYNNAFQFFEMGYASALAWIFFLLVVTLTFLNVRWSRNWV